MYIHGTFCSSCQKNALHPTDNLLAAEHVHACAEKAEKLERVKASRSVDCAICFESPAAKGRKFGLLRNCAHTFCLECVRSWRGPENVESFGTAVRSCPVCRVESYVIIPSDVFEADPEEKEKMMESYRGKMSRIPCKHFNFGEGECPFGTKCHYGHFDRQGKEQDNAPALVFSDHGSSVKKRTATLFDYL